MLDKNIFYYFIHLHVSSKKKVFLEENKKSIFVKMMTKIDEELDFQNLVFKASFNQITLSSIIRRVQGF